MSRQTFTKTASGTVTPTGPRTFEGIFSTPEPDCEDDVIAGWVFDPELALYWMHDRSLRIGTAFPEVRSDTLVGRGALYAPGHSDEAEEANDLVARGKAGISIGFFPASWPEARPRGGKHFGRVTVLEVSLTPEGKACCSSCRVSPKAAPWAMSKASNTPLPSKYDPMEDVRAYCARVRAEMDEASRRPDMGPSLAEAWNEASRRFYALMGERR